MAPGKNSTERSTEYIKAIEIDPNLFRAYNNRGVAYHFKKEYYLAIADYTKAIDISPNDANAYDNRGFTYEALGRKDEAIADFRKVLSINPSNQGSKNGLRATWRIALNLPSSR